MDRQPFAGVCPLFLVFFLKILRKKFGCFTEIAYLCIRFATHASNMVPVVQLVRMSDCGSEGHRFESDRAHKGKSLAEASFFISDCGKP